MATDCGGDVCSMFGRCCDGCLEREFLAAAARAEAEGAFAVPPIAAEEDERE